jgi:hypothetical protein
MTAMELATPFTENTVTSSTLGAEAPSPQSTTSPGAELAPPGSGLVQAVVWPVDNSLVPNPGAAVTVQSRGGGVARAEKRRGSHQHDRETLAHHVRSVSVRPVHSLAKSPLVV